MLPATLSVILALAAVGERPYEMVWAGRTRDAAPPLVDFERLEGWRAETREAEARFEPSREQQIWDEGVGKLVYRGAGPNPEVRLVPPAPVAITQAFDAVTLWVYGNNWGYAPNPATPAVDVTARFADAQGAEFGVPLGRVDWTEWSLLHRRLEPAQIERVKAGARFVGLSVAGGRNTEERTLYFDNLAVFREALPPLSFAPRPARGVPLLPGQASGPNTGPGALPFPTRPETILPDNLAHRSTTRIRAEGGAFEFVYDGSDGRAVWRLEPRTGMLDDLSVRWQGRGGTLRPCVGGGVLLADGGGRAVAPTAAVALGTRSAGDTVVSTWRLSATGVVAEVAYTFRLWGKTLVVDVVARGGQVAEVRYGKAVGLAQPRLVTNPYYLYGGDANRPAVAVSGAADAPLFLAGHTDWYRSNGSMPFAHPTVSEAGVAFNGGVRYVARTDGTRNDCYERLFLTLSPRYEEALPNVPNPASPWKRVTGTHVWFAHGAGDRQADAALWTRVRRHGLREVVVTDHETGWRDGGESFTFRTRAAPGKGGDEGQYAYARLMQDQLGFVYGPYNNYTDFAPVNAFWDSDLVSRTPENQLQHAWTRCYAPKPARAVEFCEKLAPEIQRKFRFSTAYCDVHTAVTPWDRTDYDARVPGAGTFAAVFYAFGEIMLLQKQAWGGPVYSEGGYHYLYCGLTDGNYGQDSAARLWHKPWLVDFDLRKLHPLCGNFGMGNIGMFYAEGGGLGGTPAERDARLDRFLAATVAFGHPGFLVLDGGLRNAARSYCMLQQLHSRYCLADAQEIRYVDAAGNLLDTTAAVASGAWERSQIVTRYTDGTVTAVNGSPAERLHVRAHGRTLDLPPNGYAGWTADGAVEVLSADASGGRADYAATPAYLYVDGRGRFTRFARAAADGAAICRCEPGGRCEIIPLEGAACGFRVAAAAARALAEDGRDLGPATLRTARGLTYVLPVPGAFSYLLEPATAVERSGLACERDTVTPGETVTVHGKARHALTIPADARPGERLWRAYEGQWIDFTVTRPAELRVELRGNALAVQVTSRLAEKATFAVTAAGRRADVTVKPGQTGAVDFDLGAPTDEDDATLTVSVSAAGCRESVERGLVTRRALPSLLPLPERQQAGLALRGGRETTDWGDTGAYANAGDLTCAGENRHGIVMHPPWRGSVGYAFLRFDGLRLPASPPAAWRADAGKGDGSVAGDGILYRIVVCEPGGRERVAAERVVREHRWEPLEADLSAWAGQEIAVKLIADVGAAGDSGGDWAGWSRLRIEPLHPLLTRTLLADPAPLRREPGPATAEGWKLDDLHEAPRATLHYDGKGLEGPGPYATGAVLNGVELGPLAGAGGDETKGVFQENVAIPLPAAAIRTLARRNTLEIRNPNRDCFSVRRFRIEVELPAGRRCSSEIASATWTQPAGWAHAEGVRVPEGETLTVSLWFTPPAGAP